MDTLRDLCETCEIDRKKCMIEVIDRVKGAPVKRPIFGVVTNCSNYIENIRRKPRRTS